MSDESNYEVGYKRPPKHTRFQKGQSGNPRGRPRGSRNLKTDLAEELSTRITIREGNRTRKISAQQAALKRLLAKALAGDLRAITTLVELKLRLLPEDAPEVNAPISADEAEILAAFAEEIRRQQMPAEDGKSSDGRTDRAGPEEAPQ
jgi:hypothetical protein